MIKDINLCASQVESSEQDILNSNDSWKIQCKVYLD